MREYSEPVQLFIHQTTRQVARPLSPMYWVPGVGWGFPFSMCRLAERSWMHLLSGLHRRQLYRCICSRLVMTNPVTRLAARYVMCHPFYFISSNDCRPPADEPCTHRRYRCSGGFGERISRAVAKRCARRENQPTQVSPSREGNAV